MKSMHLNELNNVENNFENLTGQAYLTPVEARKHVEKIIENEKETINFMFGNKCSDKNSQLTDLFFFDALAIPPSKYRPISQFKDQRFENSQTSQLAKLMTHNISLREILNEIISSTFLAKYINDEEATKDDKDSNDISALISQVVRLIQPK
jgi:DNA-directed RNA polymerase beta' subunit